MQTGYLTNLNNADEDQREHGGTTCLLWFLQ
jgi:hypothetical protein